MPIYEPSAAIEKLLQADPLENARRVVRLIGSGGFLPEALPPLPPRLPLGELEQLLKARARGERLAEPQRRVVLLWGAWRALHESIRERNKGIALCLLGTFQRALDARDAETAQAIHAHVVKVFGKFPRAGEPERAAEELTRGKIPGWLLGGRPKEREASGQESQFDAPGDRDPMEPSPEAEED